VSQSFSAEPPAPVPDPSSAELSSRQIWVVVAGLMVGTFPSALDVLIVITALPTIVGDLGGASHYSWIITVYLLTSIATAPLYGKLGDLVGRKRLYQVAIVIFVVGSALSGLSQNMNELIGARALQGIGAGGLGVLPMAILGDVTTPRQRPRYQGVMSINIAVATVVGPLVGGAFVDHVSWRWVFFMNIPLGAIAFVAATRLRVAAHRAAKVVLDAAGSLLIIGAAVCLLLIVTWAGSADAWTSPTILGLAAGAVALIVALVVCERRSEEPILPPRLFRIRTFIVMSTAMFFVGMAMFSPWTLMPIYFQVVTGATATNSGLLLLPLILTITVTSIVVGRLVSRWGRYKAFLVSGLAFMLLGFSLYTTIGVATPWVTTCLFMVATGLGTGMVLQLAVVIVQGAVEYRDLGVGTASVGFFQQFGGSFGTAIGLSVFNHQFISNIRTLLSARARAGLNPSAMGGSPAAIRALAPAVRHPLVEAFARSLHVGFLWVIPPAVGAFVVMLFLKEVPLIDQLPGSAVADPVAAIGVSPSPAP
jgi:EmrB/QacA subfamily drug resistance transporter